MMASNGNRDSALESGWDDAVPVARAYIEAAPERIVWATDWPHPQWKKRMMNDAETVELLYRYVDRDAELLNRILVDNPRRLHGIATFNLRPPPGSAGSSGGFGGGSGDYGGDWGGGDGGGGDGGGGGK